MATTRTHQRFSRHNQPCKCRMCGKTTTKNVDGCLYIQLCRPCYEAAGLENEHSDGYHANTPHPDCPDCKAEATT